MNQLLPRNIDTEDLVVKGVYEADFEGLRRYLLEGQQFNLSSKLARRTAPDKALEGASTNRQAQSTSSGRPCQAVFVERHGGPEVLRYRTSHAAAPNADEVQAITHGRGADAIFDGLGQAAQDENLRALAITGHWVSYGQATGPLGTVPLEALNQKSATLSRPVIFHYTADAARLRSMAANLFEMIERGKLTVHIGQRFALGDAAAAHRALEARETTGATVLLP